MSSQIDRSSALPGARNHRLTSRVALPLPSSSLVPLQSPAHPVSPSLPSSDSVL